MFKSNVLVERTRMNREILDGNVYYVSQVINGRMYDYAIPLGGTITITMAAKAARLAFNRVRYGQKKGSY